MLQNFVQERFRPPTMGSTISHVDNHPLSDSQCYHCGTAFYQEIEKGMGPEARRLLQGVSELAQATAERERETTRQMRERRRTPHVDPGQG